MERPKHEETMKYWDKIRRAIEEMKGSSHPRDMFESIIEQYDNYIDYLQQQNRV